MTAGSESERVGDRCRERASPVGVMKGSVYQTRTQAIVSAESATFVVLCSCGFGGRAGLRRSRPKRR